MRTQRLQFMGQAAYIGVVQHLRPLLQSEQLQAAAGTQPLVIFEPAEAVDVDHAVYCLPTGAQLFQSAYAQAAERQHSTRALHPLCFAEHAGELAAPLHGQATENQIDTGVLQRQAFGIADHVELRATLLPSVT